jgi:hypothetical protein
VLGFGSADSELLPGISQGELQDGENPQEESENER